MNTATETDYYFSQDLIHPYIFSAYTNVLIELLEAILSDQGLSHREDGEDALLIIDSLPENRFLAVTRG